MRLTDFVQRDEEKANLLTLWPSASPLCSFSLRRPAHPYALLLSPGLHEPDPVRARSERESVVSTLCLRPRFRSAL